MKWEAIYHRARADLVLTTERGDADAFLFEHCARVAQTALRIVELPTIRAQRLDQAAVAAAAMYHEAGWVTAVREGRVRRDEVLLRPLSEADREDGARQLEAGLAALLPPDVVRRGAWAIRSFVDHSLESVEGRVVSDAGHLLEFGLLSLWPTVRRGLFEGKGIKAAVETWRRRREYHFWDARLKDAFHFAEVRALAEHRLVRLDGFMAELAAEDAAADVEPSPPIPAGKRGARSTAD